MDACQDQRKTCIKEMVSMLISAKNSRPLHSLCLPSLRTREPSMLLRDFILSCKVAKELKIEVNFKLQD